MNRQAPKSLLWIWILWLALFYGAWLWLVVGLEHWAEAAAHWPMALAMALGSYAAGATPMGGGTVGFPVLVLLFDLPASLGRDFSFAVQSIGMVSASIFILARRQPLAWAILKGALLGATLGLPIGIGYLAPYIPELWIKVIFAVIWAGFGLLHLYRVREIAGHTGMLDFNEDWDFRLGLVLGFLSAATAVSVTGVGIDMVVYAALVLILRADLKIAIPTSVVIMAFCSLYGVAIKALFTGFQPGTYENWLAAAPVVALGAPLGVFVVNYIDRKATLVFVALLCVGQFVWTCFNEWSRLGALGVLLASGCVLALLAGFEWLRRMGDILAGERKPTAPHYASLGVEEAEPHVRSSLTHRD